MKDFDFLAQLQDDFINEVFALFQSIEESYMLLDSENKREEELGKIFRVMHSVKGTAASVGFNDVSKFAHKIEDILVTLRVYPNRMSQKTISVLLRSNDVLKSRLADLRINRYGPWDVNDAENELVSTLKNLENASNLTLAARSQDEAPKGETKVFEPSVKTVARPTVTGTSVKVDVDRIDNMLDLVGELVVIKSQLMNQIQKYSGDTRLLGIVSLMDRTIRDLQDKTFTMRLTPLKSVFLKAQRAVRDLSVKLSKPVEFTMSGEDTEVDRSMAELLADPLLHIVRNSLDHGIESKKQRLVKRKNETGSIAISAKYFGSKVEIIIKDDGAGIDSKKILKKAQEKNLVPKDVNVSQLTEAQILEYVFAPGFSTAESVSEVSGRGVGLDVVRTNLKKLKGNIDISTELDKGTCIVLRVPLTTAITDGMIVVSGAEVFVIPVDSIREFIRPGEQIVVHLENGCRALRHRGTVIPLVNLFNCLRNTESEAHSNEEKLVLIIEANNKKTAVQVQSVVGQTQVVMKPLAGDLSRIHGVSGSAILGDGKVALIVDVNALSNEVTRRGVA